MPSFLDKVGDSLDKGFKAVGAAGKDFMETSRLKREIQETEKAAEQGFTALGRRVYDMLGKGGLDEPSLRQDARAIRTLFDRVNELGAEVTRIENQAAQQAHGGASLSCAQCGGANRQGDRFCGHCGTALAAAPTPPPPVAPPACPSCGNAVKATARFCNKCGSGLA